MRLAAADIVGRANGVVLVDEELIAFGSAIGETRTESPFVWTSGNGETWAGEKLPGDKAAANTVIEWGDRMLALGHGESPRCDEQAGIASIWVRDDQRKWLQAPFAPILCNAGANAGAAAQGVAVVVGMTTDEAASVWSSDDGLRWTDTSAAFGALPGLSAGGVAVLPGGGFIAMGSGPVPVWVSRSNDGVTWERPAAIEGAPAGHPLAIVSRDDQVTLFLRVATGEMVRLQSRDGATWVAAAAEGLVSDEVRIQSFSRGLIATGLGPDGRLVWVSSDGARWRLVALPPGVTADGIWGGALIADHAVLVGEVDGDASGPAPAAWYGPASLLVP